MRKDMGGNSGSKASPQARSGLGPTGYDPGRDGFPRERLLYAATSLAAIASQKARDVAYGAWNPLNMGSDATLEASEFFNELRQALEHCAYQVGEAALAQAIEARSDGTGDTGPAREGESAVA